MSLGEAPVYLDLQRWPRRDAFDFYRGFDKPYFNLCVRLDVAALQTAVRATGTRFSLACHYIVLHLANQIEPFRYRLEGGQVRIHPVVNGGNTVLRDDQSIAFAYFDYHASYAQFAAQAEHALALARAGGFAPRADAVALMHFTTLPWVHFSSFSHARNWGREDSVPKIAFGRVDADGERRWMPMSVEVHHALMDGLHVGQFVQRLEAAVQEPLAWLTS